MPLAEWYKRDPTEPPFERGEVVGLGPDGLTRQTCGSQQLGIITAQAAVAGSTPVHPVEASKGDYVAFTGIVAVKVRGAVHRDDYIVPSGLQDGTCKAVTSQLAPSAYVGRANQDGPGSKPSMFSRIEKAPTWQLIDCNVIAPVHTVAGKHRRHQHCGVAAALLLLFAGVVFVCRSLGSSTGQHVRVAVSPENATSAGRVVKFVL
eukprot:COSAG06_NODE_12788_length_1330_cov_0.811535_2_plen_205_part_00